MKVSYVIAGALALLMLMVMPVVAPYPVPLPPTHDGVVPTIYNYQNYLCAADNPVPDGSYPVVFKVNAWNDPITGAQTIGPGSFDILDNDGIVIGTISYTDMYEHVWHNPSTNSDEKQWVFDWSVSGGTYTGVVAVKAGNAQNLLYNYTDSYANWDGDEWLYAPKVGGGSDQYKNWAQISHFNFCGYFTPNPEVCYGPDDTAWAEGTRYQNPGNWATYVTYDGTETTVTIYAGQTTNVGTATISAPDDGQVIDINLNSPYVFFQTTLDEYDLHIQDYAIAPTGNPAPGTFDWNYTINLGETLASVSVPANNYYGIHLKVAPIVECSETV
jgi:hypothetical protein